MAHEQPKGEPEEQSKQQEEQGEELKKMEVSEQEVSEADKLKALGPEKLARLNLVKEKGFRDALLQKLSPAGAAGGAASSNQEHQFWDSQPVPKYDEQVAKKNQGPIETKTVEEVRADPYPLVAGFEWSDVNIFDPADLEEVYQLLCRHYVEDDDSVFRFDYGRQFLQWALTPPGFRPEWHLGVRAATGKKPLVALITAVPTKMNVNQQEVPMVEINYLCVHKKLRTKRLAPVLIKEITRRVNLQDIWQAAYTAGIVIPKPIAAARYWHRTLNAPKLLDVKFTHLKDRMTVNQTVRLYRLPPQPELPGLRPMQEEDVASAHALVSKYLRRFRLAPIWNQEEFQHWFLPRKDVIYTYVIVNPDSKNVVALTSFFCLPSSVSNHPKHKELRAAYSFYTVIAPGKKAGKLVTQKSLFRDALIMANAEGFDVFNALNVMDNQQVFEDLHFGLGDGNLQYYLYNWRTPTIQSSEVGLVLM